MNAIISAGLKYFLIFLLLFAVLTGISLIPGVGASCNRLYRNTTESILKITFPSVRFDLKADKTNADVIEIEYVSKEAIEQMRRQNRGANQNSFQVRTKIYDVKFYNVFLSFWIFFIALMILSPLPIKDKLIGALIGSILFYLYSVLKIAFKLLIFFNQSEPPIYQTSDFLLGISKGFTYFQTLGTSVLIVIVLWGLLAFRKNNWKELLKVK